MTVFQAQIGAVEEFATKLADSNTTVLVEGTDTDGAWYVPWVQCNENAGGTPALTLELFDGTIAYSLGAGGVTYAAKALTAGQSVTFSEGIPVPVGWSLRAKSGDAAGKITIVGTKARRLG